MSNLAREIQNLREGDEKGIDRLIREAGRHQEHGLVREAMRKMKRGWKRRWASYILYWSIETAPEGEWVWVGRVHDLWGDLISRSHFVGCAHLLMGAQIGKGRPASRRETGVRKNPSLPYLIDDLLGAIQDGVRYGSGWGMLDLTLNPRGGRRLASPPITIRDILNLHTEFDWQTTVDRWSLVVPPSTQANCFGFVELSIAEALTIQRPSPSMKYRVDFPDSNYFLYATQEAAKALDPLLKVDVVGRVEDYLQELAKLFNLT